MPSAFQKFTSAPTVIAEGVLRAFSKENTCSFHVTKRRRRRFLKRRTSIAIGSLTKKTPGNDACDTCKKGALLFSILIFLAGPTDMNKDGSTFLSRSLCS
jgi:hypothetical protein